MKRRLRSVGKLMESSRREAGGVDRGGAVGMYGSGWSQNMSRRYNEQNLVTDVLWRMEERRRQVSDFSMIFITEIEMDNRNRSRFG